MGRDRQNPLSLSGKHKYYLCCMKFDGMYRMPVIKYFGFQSRREMLEYASKNHLMTRSRPEQFVIINCESGEVERGSANIYKEMESLKLKEKELVNVET